MTYNICAKCNSESNYQDIIDAIQEINPDICALQEVDSVNFRSLFNVSKLVGDSSNMYHNFHPVYYFSSGGAYGDAMLYDSIPNLNTFTKFRHQDYGSIIVSETYITMNKEKVAIYNTHLTYLKSEYRIYQINDILKWINNRNNPETPIILLGDFNAKIDSAAVNLIEADRFKIAKNENGTTPAKVDHIAFRPENRWKLDKVGSPHQHKGSDHYPVWAKLELLGNRLNRNISDILFEVDEIKSYPNPFTD